MSVKPAERRWPGPVAATLPRLDRRGTDAGQAGEVLLSPALPAPKLGQYRGQLGGGPLGGVEVARRLEPGRGEDVRYRAPQRTGERTGLSPAGPRRPAFPGVQRPR
jgi:hypothetical protein